MPKYNYTAKEDQGNVLEGVVDALSLEDAIRKITQTGSIPVDVHLLDKVKPKAKPLSLNTGWFLRKVKQKDIALFTRQLSDLMEASVPILRSVQLIGNQTVNPHLKKVVSDVEQAIVNGSSLAGALQDHPSLFSSFYTELVRAGEASGELSQILKRIANYLEKEQDIKKKIISALSYPLFVLGIGFLTMVVFITFVIPRISVMFDDLGQSLPWITTALINMSTFFVQYGWLVLLVSFVGGYLVYRYVQTATGHHKLDELKLKLPLYGEFIRTIEVGHAARTLGALIDAGIPISMALNLLWTTLHNRVFQEEMIKVPSYIAEGMSLHKALEQTHLFPEMPLNMVSVGEETGELGQSFNKIADIYERQSEESLKTILSLLGPALLVVIVLIIGAMLMAMLLPIFEMNLII